MTAMVVVTPNQGSAKNAAAIKIPSTKLWNASPIRIFQTTGAARLDLSPSGPWLCRQMDIFSKKKKANIPSNKTPRTSCNWFGANSYTSGKILKKVLASMTPAEKATNLCNHNALILKANIAATKMLKMPPTKHARNVYNIGIFIQ
jgi:hypothetical protein